MFLIIFQLFFLLKLAFNKRVRSVKAKRDKLNAEMRQRNSPQPESSPSEGALPVDDSSACTCVKCSIVYHEAKIKGTTPDEIKCTLKYQQKLVNCSKTSSDTTADESLSPAPTPPKNDFAQFETKLFNIKNELVNSLEIRHYYFN